MANAQKKTVNTEKNKIAKLRHFPGKKWGLWRPPRIFFSKKKSTNFTIWNSSTKPKIFFEMLLFPG
jgi:hypothetical protein